MEEGMKEDREKERKEGVCGDKCKEQWIECDKKGEE
jgi:hypothetical protein